jgi:phage/plasmid-associated DNA primase
MTVTDRANRKAQAALRALDIYQARWERIKGFYDTQLTLGFADETPEEQAYWQQEAAEFRQYTQRYYGAHK